jgi:hypothetical protein
MTCEDQVLALLHFLGTNSFYHDICTGHDISTASVCRIVKDTEEAILTLKDEFVHWPEDCLPVVNKFCAKAQFPAVVEAVDGSKVIVNPPQAQEEDYIDCHGNTSLNLTLVSGPDTQIYFCSSKCSGR